MRAAGGRLRAESVDVKGLPPLKPAANDVGLGTGQQSSMLSEDSIKSFAYTLPSQPRAESFTAIQEWEGFVTSISPDQGSFFARLVDKTAKKKVAEETIEIQVSDVSESDAHLIKEGAIFRLAIGHARSAAGTRRKVSEIVFRRLPAWTERDIREARQKAEQLVSALKWE